MHSCPLLRIALLLGASATTVHAEQALAPPADPLYRSVADDVYLQEVGQKVASKQPVTAIRVFRGEVAAVTGGRLVRLAGNELSEIDGAPPGLQRLFVFNDALWGTTDDAVYRYDGDHVRKVFDGAMVDLCLHLGEVHGATRNEVFRFDGETFVNIKPAAGWRSSDSTVTMADGRQVLVRPVQLGPILRIASYSGTLYLLGPSGPRLLDGAVFEEEPVDWGEMPSRNARDMLAQGSRLLMATDRGVAVLRGAALTTLDGDDGLPYEDVQCLAPGFARDLWIGTARGVIRQTGDQFHYFNADHWLPAERVRDIAVDGKTVYVATDRGIGIIEYQPYTLRKKAAYFERNVARRGHQRLGFVHKLYYSGPDKGWLREISDNDGGHTAHYLAAMCFKFAVTGEDSARRQALDAAEAMIWLRTITGVDGFFARAIWAVDVDQGARSTQGSGGLPAKWVATDDGRWLWKGDTSSDEVNAHFYAMALFHDLVAQGDEKRRAAEHLAQIARHIVDNGWVLRDADGEPTRWGRWDPEYLQRPYGIDAIGLNGMEAQSYMWTALTLSGDSFFRAGLDQLLEWRYHEHTVREKLIFPPANVVPWDDELAFHCFMPLLTYCDDDDLRSIYLRALERHWEVMRMQKIPFFNFTYGGLTGNDCEAAEAVAHLREWSLDTVSHTYRNSHRADLAVEPGYTPYQGGSKAMSPRNIDSRWGSRSALGYDGGSNGRTATPPVGWIEDYWMGRFFGMIAPPTTTDAQLLTPPTSDEVFEGAAPYDGPPRPENHLSN